MRLQHLLFREELDIMGADGHIYRGRYENQHLPDLPQTAPVSNFTYLSLPATVK